MTAQAAENGSTVVKSAFEDATNLGLNAAALERNINFSQVLQDALKSQLHLG